MIRKSATRMRPAIAARNASCSESSPSVAEISVDVSVLKPTGRAPVCRTSAICFASLRSSMPVICAEPPPMPFDSDPSVWSICGHDLISRSRTMAKLLRDAASLAAHPLVARDLLELVAALVRELHEDDRLPGRRVEVLARAREPQVGARQLRERDPRAPRLRRVLEEVVEVLLGVLDADARADRLPDAAAHDHRVGRHGKDTRSLRHLSVTSCAAAPPRVGAGPARSFFPLRWKR